MSLNPIEELRSRACSVCAELGASVPSRVLSAPLLIGSFSPGRFVPLESFCSFLFLSSSGFPSAICSWVCLPPHSFSHTHHVFTLISLCFHFLLLVLFGLLEFSLSDSLPVIRGRNSLFPWRLRKNAAHSSLPPCRYLGSALSLAAHHEAAAVLAAACLCLATGGCRARPCLRLVFLPDPRHGAGSQLLAAESRLPSSRRADHTGPGGRCQVSRSPWTWEPRWHHLVGGGGTRNCCHTLPRAWVRL